MKSTPSRINSGKIPEYSFFAASQMLLLPLFVLAAVFLMSVLCTRVFLWL